MRKLIFLIFAMLTLASSQTVVNYRLIYVDSLKSFTDKTSLDSIRIKSRVRAYNPAQFDSLVRFMTNFAVPAGSSYDTTRFGYLDKTQTFAGAKTFNDIRVADLLKMGTAAGADGYFEIYNGTNTNKTSLFAQLATSDISLYFPDSSGHFALQQYVLKNGDSTLNRTFSDLKYLKNADSASFRDFSDIRYWQKSILDTSNLHYTKLAAKIPYSDTTSSLAMQWELDRKLWVTDTTNKWAPKGTYIFPSDTSVFLRRSDSSFYVTRYDTASKWAPLGTYILPSDTSIFIRESDTTYMLLRHSMKDTAAFRTASNAYYVPKVGSTNVTTLGTITTGTWNGVSIDTAYTNAVSKITTVGTGLTVTKIAKDYRLYIDTTHFVTRYDTASKWAPLGTYILPSDTSVFLRRIDSSFYVTRYDTASKWAPRGTYIFPSDTTLISNRLNAKLWSADTVTFRTASNAYYAPKIGSTNITTLGTIGTGTWNATSIDTNKTNAVSKITVVGSGLTVTKQAKDYRLYADTSYLVTRYDTAGRWAPAGSYISGDYIPYSDTTSVVAMQWELNRKLWITDTSAFVRDADTSYMLDRRFMRDTVSLSNRINLKLNIADTSAFLRRVDSSFYVTRYDTAGKWAPLGTYILPGDTSVFLRRSDSSFYVTRYDTASRWAPVGTYILPSDTSAFYRRSDTTLLASKSFVAGQYVPYSGATRDINIGENKLTIGSGTISGTSKQLNLTNSGADTVGIRFERTGTNQHDWEIITVAGEMRLRHSANTASFTDALTFSSSRVPTFSEIPILPASNPTTANQAARKTYVDTKLALSDTSNLHYTKLAAKLNYSDTTSLLAMQWELDRKLWITDTTSKWAPKGTYIFPSDTILLSNRINAKLWSSDTATFRTASNAYYAPKVGSTNITTLGTIGTGTWNATSIDTNKTDAVSKITAIGTGLTVTKIAKDYRLYIDSTHFVTRYDTAGKWAPSGSYQAAGTYLVPSDTSTFRTASNVYYAPKIGSTNITTLGTIATGTWNGTSIDTAYTNAVSKITTIGTGLTATKIAKDYRLYADTTFFVTRYDTSDFLRDADTATIVSKRQGNIGLVTVGTITSGVWQSATHIDTAYSKSIAKITTAGNGLTVTAYGTNSRDYQVKLDTTFLLTRYDTSGVFLMVNDTATMLSNHSKRDTAAFRTASTAYYAPKIGSTNITTLGTIGTGTWNATSIDTNKTDAVSKITTIGTGLTVTKIAKDYRLYLDTTFLVTRYDTAGRWAPAGSYISGDYIPYSDTTSVVAMQWELNRKLWITDTTSKWAPLGTYILPSDTSVFVRRADSSFYVTRYDTSSRWAPTGTYIFPSDTTLLSNRINAKLWSSDTTTFRTFSDSSYGRVDETNIWNGTNYFTTKIMGVTGSTSQATLSIPHGAAPSSPVNGDMWSTTSALYFRLNGTTRTMAHTASWSAMGIAEARTGTATTSRFIQASVLDEAIYFHTGWDKGTSTSKIFQRTAGDSLNIRVNDADTTQGGGLFTNWGTTSLKGAVTLGSTINGYTLNQGSALSDTSKFVLYSDTTSSVAMQWELDGKFDISDTSYLMTLGSNQLITSPKWYTARQYMTSIEYDTAQARNFTPMILATKPPYSTLTGLDMTSNGAYHVNLLGANVRAIRQTTGGFAYANSADTLRFGHATVSMNVPFVAHTTTATSAGNPLTGIGIMQDQSADSSSWVWLPYLSNNGSGGTSTTSMEFIKFKNTSESNLGKWDGNKYWVAIRFDTSNNIKFNDAKSADFTYGNMYLSNGNFAVSGGSADADSFQLNGTTVLSKVTWHSGLGSFSGGASTLSSLVSIGAITSGDIIKARTSDANVGTIELGVNQRGYLTSYNNGVKIQTWNGATHRDQLTMNGADSSNTFTGVVKAPNIVYNLWSSPVASDGTINDDVSGTETEWIQNGMAVAYKVLVYYRHRTGNKYIRATALYKCNIDIITPNLSVGGTDADAPDGITSASYTPYSFVYDVSGLTNGTLYEVKYGYRVADGIDDGYVKRLVIDVESVQ